MDLDKVKTIVIVIMENRSFDHMLGQLGLDPAYQGRIEGIKPQEEWLDQVANPYGDHLSFKPFHFLDPFSKLDADPPHGRDEIKNQMGPPAGDVFPMKGFVQNYATAPGAASLTPDKPPPVMGYYGKDEAPVTDFLARNFAVCDRWFAALPASTHPNRFMAMSGVTPIDGTLIPLPHRPLVYDWLGERGVRWRVYHETIPFFAMMRQWIPAVLAGDRFRPLEQLRYDIENDPPEELPQVIFVEPAYGDGPHLGESTDDHAPSAIKGGQKFLLEVYRDLTEDPDLWAGTVLIVTYDEHGGFFDHVSPPRQITAPPPGAQWTESTNFETLGVRVPALVVSPLVEPGSVCHEIFDHTSILKFLGEKFGGGQGYSAEVDARGTVSVQRALRDDLPQRDMPIIPSLDDYLQREQEAAGQVRGQPPQTEMQRAFKQALDDIREQPGPKPQQIADLLDAFPPGGAV